MRIAVDTNVLSGLPSGGPEPASEARISLENARAAEPLLVSPAVYAEFAAGGSADYADEFPRGKGIEVDWLLGRDVWRAAGSRYGAYARGRRWLRGDTGPRRIPADFPIGAHALHLDRVLLSSDAGIYGSHFPELEVLRPQDRAGGSA